jgi:alkyl sulfatase BDS1-like metallo-beta-lactamase superfamily hydrolase
MTDDLRQPATESTIELLRLAGGSLPFEDLTDFERARRGRLIDGPRSINGALGHFVWNRDDFSFEEGVTPDTVHPSLWRQAQLNNEAGLFEVIDGVYQVRGLDISNITFIRGDRGWIVIDPLTGEETARAARSVVDDHFGARPISAVIYTHSHTDHFGGVRGIVSQEQVASGEVPVIAPAGFLEAAVSENVIAGTAMIRRSMYMYGVLLPKDERGHVDTGLGKGLPAMPTVWLIPPTDDITTSGETRLIDGVNLVFQLTPGTEAPAEMNIYLPQFRALCLAENCTANLHNLYTLRGAQVRDALGWSKYVQECLEEYADHIDVSFASHHWPRWGRDEIVEFLENQRDLYRCIHDQTMRMANQGLTMNEISEEITLPPHLRSQFYNRDYYGTIRHNAKAVYQRYLGWFDANPAHLNPHPPVAAGARYVEFMGGADALLSKARDSFRAGDYRWVAEVVNHLVFSDPSNEEARLLQANALEQLGYQSESGPWRDFYLTGAMELRSNGTMLKGVRGNANGPAFTTNMPLSMLVDILGVRINTPRAEQLFGAIQIEVSDGSREAITLVVRGGVLSISRSSETVTVVSVRTSQDALARFVGGGLSHDEFRGRDDVEIEGDEDFFKVFADSLDVFEFGFEIVLP